MRLADCQSPHRLYGTGAAGCAPDGAWRSARYHALGGAGGAVGPGGLPLPAAGTARGTVAAGRRRSAKDARR